MWWGPYSLTEFVSQATEDSLNHGKRGNETRKKTKGNVGVRGQRCPGVFGHLKSKRSYSKQGQLAVSGPYYRVRGVKKRTCGIKKRNNTLGEVGGENCKTTQKKKRGVGNIGKAATRSLPIQNSHPPSVPPGLL